MPKQKWLILIVLPWLLILPQASHALKPIRTMEHIIVLDPGHGGSDSGLTSPSGLKEKEITLLLAQRLKRHLDSRYTVFLTRTDDITLSLRERVSFANHKKSDLFISIHLNRSRSGARFFYHTPSDNRSKPTHAWETAGLKYQDRSRAICRLFIDTFSKNHITSLPAKKDLAIIPLEGAMMPAILAEPFSITQLPHHPKKQERFMKQYISALVQCIDQFSALKPDTP